MRFTYISVCVMACAGLGWAAGNTSVLFFISSDCPISNSYAPEIQRLCSEYRTKGEGCSLVYDDVGLDASSMQKHFTEYRYAKIPAVIDGKREIANRVHATVTPQAVVTDSKGEIRYRGRIDNFYAALGKPRQQVTAHDLRDALDAVLAGRPVQNP